MATDVVLKARRVSELYFAAKELIEAFESKMAQAADLSDPESNAMWRLQIAVEAYENGNLVGPK